jgi:GTP-binding protein
VLIDRARIFVKAGDGGNGAVSFRREKFVPRGGPDGGDGGRGGDVRMRVNPHMTSLLAFQFNQHFKAENGRGGMGGNKHGRAGKPKVIEVPAGTVVWDDERGELLADLTDAGESVIVARGGKGGLGNAHFKTSVHQAPRLAELGEPGDERWLRLELRIIADVGLIGLPNAGKSTLLASSSRARPKIADYPFTTLEPNLGVVEIGGPGGQVYVMADVPGRIEGAAAGAGLGHEFRRHVTRTGVVVHVVDASGGLEGRDPLADFATINEEVAAYDPNLAEKPMLVALNKIDLPEARENLSRLHETLRRQGYEVFDISAATGEGVPALLNATAAALREMAERKEPVEKPQERRRYTLANTDERAYTVTRRSRHHFDVAGVGIERLTKMTNFSQDEAVRRFQRVLETSGIEAELEKLGVQPGDTVHIGEFDLVWGTPEEIEAAQHPERFAEMEAAAQEE